MSDISWSAHQDPCLDGPPIVSPDGHWRWDGNDWVSLTHGTDHEADHDSAHSTAPAA